MVGTMTNLYPTASIRKVMNGYQILVEIPSLYLEAQQRQFQAVVSALQNGQSGPVMFAPSEEEQWERVFVSETIDGALDIIKRELSGLDVPEVFKEAFGGTLDPQVPDGEN